MTGHLDFARLASLVVDHQAALLHLSRCASCQVRVAEQLEPIRPQQEPDVEAAIRRLLGQLEQRQHFTDRIEALGQEHREAVELVRELRAAPDSWGTAGSDLRYASPEVVWQLLETARDEEPTCALRIIALAEEIVHSLSAVLPPPPKPLCQQLKAEVRCARAENLIDSGFHAAASRELRSAAAALAPDLGHGRAIYCRVLARLRREQKRWDEAIALADRAVSLLDDFGSTFEAAQAQIEQGWILLEAGDAAEALPLLSAALQLLGVAPAWRVMGQLGHGMAEALLGHPMEAERLLAEADAGLPGVSSPAARLRLRWISGQVARSCGHRCSAFRRFCRTAIAFVTLGDEHTGALALLELMAFCVECGWPLISDN
jgi:tetratricopeptide (TPR) repeat protein